MSEKIKDQVALAQQDVRQATVLPEATGSACLPYGTLEGLYWTELGRREELERELVAWRARFPEHEYRRQDECVALKLGERTKLMRQVLPKPEIGKSCNSCGCCCQHDAPESDWLLEFLEEKKKKMYRRLLVVRWLSILWGMIAVTTGFYSLSVGAHGWSVAVAICTGIAVVVFTLLAIWRK